MSSESLTRPAVSVGVALLATAVVISTYYARVKNHLDGSVYTVGVVATVGLLAVAVVSYLRDRDDAATDLVAWPGAFGIAGVGLMIQVALDEADATVYVAGGVALVLALGALLLTRRGPFVVVAVVAAFAVYVQALTDIFTGNELGEELPGIKIALALTLFAVLGTAACWVRPESRVLGSAVVGGLTVVAFAGVTGALSISQVLMPMGVDGTFYGGGADSGGITVGPYADYEGPTYDGFTDDAWTILVLAVVLMLAWAALAALTGHVAFRILVVAMAVSVIPLVTQVLTVEHPTWWGVALGALGGLALVAVALQAPRREAAPEPATPDA